MKTHFPEAKIMAMSGGGFLDAENLLIPPKPKENLKGIPQKPEVLVEPDRLAVAIF